MHQEHVTSNLYNTIWDQGENHKERFFTIQSRRTVNLIFASLSSFGDTKGLVRQLEEQPWLCFVPRKSAQRILSDKIQALAKVCRIWELSVLKIRLAIQESRPSKPGVSQHGLCGRILHAQAARHQVGALYSRNSSPKITTRWHSELLATWIKCSTSESRRSWWSLKLRLGQTGYFFWAFLGSRWSSRLPVNRSSENLTS